MTVDSQRLSQWPSAWRQAAPPLLLVLGAVLVAYRETAAAMVAIWSRSDTFAHGFLVLPIVVWLVWRQRHALVSLRPQPCGWMLPLMLGVALVWMLGDVASINSVTQLAMTALLVLSVPAVLGLRVANAILFPLAFLFFAVPIGEFLLPQLMAWTADFTVLALRASGIPVFREGTHIVLPSGSWSVVEACSGVRYLIASFMVGTMFAYLNYRSTPRRWIFAGIAIAVPVVANWVRAYLVVLVGHLSNNRLAAGADHLIYGWVFFGVVVGLMFAIGMLWAEPEAATASPIRAVPPILAERVAAKPAVPAAGAAPGWAVAAVAIALVLLPRLAVQAIGSVDNAAPPQLATLSPLADGWRASDQPLAAWKPAFQNPSAELNTTYASPDRKVGVYIAYYRAQNYGRKLVSSDNELVKSTDPVWAQVGPLGSYTLRVTDQTLTVRTAPLRGIASPGMPEQRLAVWQLYWVGGKLTSSEYWAKVYAATDRLLGHGDDAAVIVLYTNEDQPNHARATLEAFARGNLGAIVAQLRKTRDDVQASVAANSARM